MKVELNLAVIEDSQNPRGKRSRSHEVLEQFSPESFLVEHIQVFGAHGALSYRQRSFCSCLQPLVGGNDVGKLGILRTPTFISLVS